MSRLSVPLRYPVPACVRSLCCGYSCWLPCQYPSALFCCVIILLVRSPLSVPCSARVICCFYSCWAPYKHPSALFCCVILLVIQLVRCPVLCRVPSAVPAPAGLNVTLLSSPVADVTAICLLFRWCSRVVSRILLFLLLLITILTSFCSVLLCKSACCHVSPLPFSV